MKRVKKVNVITLILFIVNLVLYFFILKAIKNVGEGKEIISCNHVETLDFEEHCNPDFSEVHLMDLLLEFNIEHPHIVFAQAVLESSNFGSKIFVENNNMFGMKNPSVRNTTSIGENRGHAVYEDWVQSVVDYSLWQSRYARGLTEQEYLAKLDRVYATDSRYSQKIKQLIREQ